MKIMLAVLFLSQIGLVYAFYRINKRISDFEKRATTENPPELDGKMEIEGKKRVTRQEFMDLQLENVLYDAKHPLDNFEVIHE